MTMSNTTKSFRTSDENNNFISSLHGSVSAGATKAIEAYVNIRPLVLKSLEKKLEGDDIAVLAKALKGSQFDPNYMASKAVLHSKIVAELDRTDDSRAGSVLSVLSEKVKTFTEAECYFLQEEVYRRIS